MKLLGAKLLGIFALLRSLRLAFDPANYFFFSSERRFIRAPASALQMLLEKLQRLGPEFFCRLFAVIPWHSA
jgi:hypothetical protein